MESENRVADEGHRKAGLACMSPGNPLDIIDILGILVFVIVYWLFYKD